MTKNLRDAIKDRLSYYQIKNESPVSDDEIKSIIEHVLIHTPSSFNSQSTRLVLLLGGNHKHFWEITKAELKKASLAEEAFKAAEQKVDTSFGAGCTILFFEDQTAFKSLQEQFPFIASNFG